MARRFREAYETTFTVVRSWQGREVEFELRYAVQGTTYPGCRQTHWSPAEPPSFEVEEEQLEVLSATALDAGPDPEQTEALRKFGLAEGALHVEQHAAEFEEEWMQKAAERDAAAEDAYWDAKIDEARGK